MEIADGESARAIHHRTITTTTTTISRVCSIIAIAISRVVASIWE